MAEVYSFAEGQAYIYTGAVTASGAALSFVTDVRCVMRTDQDNYRNMSGNYNFVEVWREFQAQLSIQYTGGTFLNVVQTSGIDTHLRLSHLSLGNSGGWLAYSGRILSLTPAAAEGGVVVLQVEYKANQWSAF